MRCVARIVVFFFFSSRRRHTRFDCDWSSDVCSSDLGGHARRSELEQQSLLCEPRQHRCAKRSGSGRPGRYEIGRAACRERVEISVVAGSLKKKKKKNHERCIWNQTTVE